eukprot:GEMP01095262.1.p1 GENE.GEMP01095262.1~~GEMP01095262.1.p1  ORF type:complete len:156 (-),score=1.40 GEMP01095262.1:37-504(-)
MGVATLILLILYYVYGNAPKCFINGCGPPSPSVITRKNKKCKIYFLTNVQKKNDAKQKISAFFFGRYLKLPKIKGDFQLCIQKYASYRKNCPRVRPRIVVKGAMTPVSNTINGLTLSIVTPNHPSDFCMGSTPSEVTGIGGSSFTKLLRGYRCSA